ncbi:MAG: glutamyl-tRNA reductase [Nitrososphaerota archaeon]|nr:glutamyl-tRNA reductase [Nitrososphaerota archaeon]MDG7023676.1 glutamyl-tRNA reductase [Nitrososphaerota archaeon]
MDHSDPAERVLNIRVTHKRATVPVLETVRFESPAGAMREISRLATVSECAVLQTCNRVEVYALASKTVVEAVAGIEKKWFRTADRRRAADGALEISEGAHAIEHLLRVAAGLESMVIGENEILRQTKTAYEAGRKARSIGPVLDEVFQSALRLGRSVRASTAINRGAVSVGSAGVELLLKSMGGLGGRKVLVIGAGEVGATVARALASRRSGVIFVANRTFQKAVELAKNLGGKALRFDALEKSLARVDAVVVATSAPHSILSFPMMSDVMEARGGRPLVVVDLAEPRNVDLTVARLPGVTLWNLDDLRGVLRSGIEKRSREVRKAEKLVEERLGETLLSLRQDRVEPFVTSLFQAAESIREKEAEKAVMRIAKSGDHAAAIAVVDDLSRVLVKRLLSGPVEYMRGSAAKGDFASLDVAEKLFMAGNGNPSGSNKKST